MDVKGFTVKEQIVNDDLQNNGVSEELPSNDVIKELPKNDVMERHESSEQHEKFRDYCLASGAFNDADGTTEVLNHSYEAFDVIGFDSNSATPREDVNRGESLCETLTDFFQDDVVYEASQDAEFAFPTNQGLQDTFNSDDLPLKYSEKVNEGIVVDKTVSKDSNALYPENTNTSNSSNCYEDKYSVFQTNSLNSYKKMESNSFTDENTIKTPAKSTQLYHTVLREDKDNPLIASSEKQILFCEALEKGETIAKKNELDRKKSEDDNGKVLTKSYPNVDYEDSEDQESGNSQLLEPVQLLGEKILDEYLNERGTHLQQIANIVKLAQDQPKKAPATDDLDNKLKLGNNHKEIVEDVEKRSVEVNDCSSPRFESTEETNVNNDRKDLNDEELPLCQSDNVDLKRSAMVSDLLSVTTKEDSLKEHSYNASYELDGNNLSTFKSIGEKSNDSNSRKQEEMSGEREAGTTPKIVAEINGTSNVFPTNTSVIGNNHKEEVGVEKSSMAINGRTSPIFESCEVTKLENDRKDLNVDDLPLCQSNDVNLKSSTTVSDVLNVTIKEDSLGEHSYCASYELGGNNISTFKCLSERSRESNSCLEEMIGEREAEIEPKCVAEISGTSNLFHTNISLKKNHDNSENLFSEFSEGGLDFTVEINKEFEIGDANYADNEQLQNFNTSKTPEMPTDFTYTLETRKPNLVQPVKCFANLSAVEFRREQIFHDHTYSLIGKKIIEVITEDHTYSKESSDIGLKHRSNLTLHTKNGPIKIYRVPEILNKIKETPIAIHRQTKTNDELHTKYNPQTTNHGPLVVHSPKTTLKAPSQATVPLFATLTETNKEKLFLVTKSGIMSIQSVLNRAETSKNILHQFKVDNPNVNSLSISQQEKEETRRNGGSKMLKTVDIPIQTVEETHPSENNGMIIQHIRKYVHDTKTGSVAEEKLSESYILHSRSGAPKPYKTLVVKKPYYDDEPEYMYCNEGKEDNRQGRPDLINNFSTIFSVRGVPPNNNFQKYLATRQFKYPSQVVLNTVHPGRKQNRNASHERVVNYPKRSLLDTKPNIIQTIIPDVKIHVATDGSYYSRNKTLTPLRKFYHISKKTLKGKYLVVEGANGCYFKKLFSAELKDGVYLEVIYETDKIFAECIAKQMQDPTFEITENVPFSTRRRTCHVKNLEVTDSPTPNVNTYEAEEENPLRIGAVFTLNQKSEENVATLKEISNDPVRSKSLKHQKRYTDIPRLQKIKHRCRGMMWREALKMFTIPIDEVDFWSWPENFHDPWGDPKLRKFSRVVLKSLSLENMHLKGIDEKCSKSCRQEIVCLSLNAKIKKLTQERKRICREFGIPLRQISLPKKKKAIIDKENALNTEINGIETSEGVCYSEANELNECSVENLSMTASEEVQSQCDREGDFSSSSGVVFSEEQNENTVILQTNEIKMEIESDDETLPGFEKEIMQDNLENLVAVKEEPVSEGYGDESDDYNVLSRQKELFEQIEYVTDEPISEDYAETLDTVKSLNNRKRCFSEHESDNGDQGFSFLGQDLLNCENKCEMDVAIRYKRYQSLGPSPNKIPSVKPSEEYRLGNSDDFPSKVLHQIKVENETHTTKEETERETGVIERIKNLRKCLKQCEKKISALKETKTLED